MVTSRWLAETGGTRGAAYDDAFCALAAGGADVHGEANFVDALLPVPSHVLDAGCGTGRVAVELARRGHHVVGVDSDASMLDVARRSGNVTWRDQDLAALVDDAAYDLVVAAGNVLVYLAEGSEPEVVRRLALALVPGGLLVSGWCTRREPHDDRPVASVEQYDRWTAAAGLESVSRLAGWDSAPLTPHAAWCVAVDRRPGG